MSRAEEKLLNRYPTFAEKYAFIDGYEQAEKDNELTWEDVKGIYCIALNLREHVGSSVFGQPFYEEVLKRFKDFRERKEK